jgi:DNA-binding transcriptional MerR regulator
VSEINQRNIYLMKDLARRTGYSVHTLKYYLKLGLIRESGRSPETRFRYFDDETVAKLARIREWRRQRRSLAEIQGALQGEGEPVHRVGA